MYQLHSLFLVESNQRHAHLLPTKEYPRNLDISLFLYLPFLSSSVNKKIKHDVRIKDISNLVRTTRFIRVGIHSLIGEPNNQRI